MRRPFIVLLEQQFADKTDDGFVVEKDANDLAVSISKEKVGCSSRSPRMHLSIAVPGRRTSVTMLMHILCDSTA
ncbi:hypothetical protein SM11_pC1203 (plasmid) [Sinorhizobium meliloti SM11]|uniref:Uncharacterized protein n=1 Tax=Sinorhizobium meliloti (strain SM11) TaxID=707241 RepID=F7XFF1_SINMM|nr:hypothetical protein SM11_pC1203 [Sinorhizobium meliloti SM11]